MNWGGDIPRQNLKLMENRGVWKNRIRESDGFGNGIDLEWFPWGWACCFLRRERYYPDAYFRDPIISLTVAALMALEEIPSDSFYCESGLIIGGAGEGNKMLPKLRQDFPDCPIEGNDWDSAIRRSA